MEKDFRRDKLAFKKVPDSLRLPTANLGLGESNELGTTFSKVSSEDSNTNMLSVTLFTMSLNRASTSSF